MRKALEAGFNAESVELSTQSDFAGVGARGEGGGESVVVGFQAAEGVDLLEEMEGVGESVAMDEVLEKAIEFD